MASLVERSQSLKREDISDKLVMVKADETPFVSMVKKGPEANNSLTEWPVDVPVEPNTVGVVDDQDATEFENLSDRRNKLQGRIQIFERRPKVSRLSNIVSDVAGVGKRKEFARAIAKAMIAVKLDMEARCVGTDDSQSDNGTVGYETRGAAAWVSSTAQTDLPVPEAYRTPSGNISAPGNLSGFTEANFIALLKSRYDATGLKGMIDVFVSSAFKAHVDNWSVYVTSVGGQSVVRQFNNNPTDKKIAPIIDILDTSFGKAALHLHRHLGYDGTNAQTNLGTLGALGLDMDYFEWGSTQNPTRMDLPNLGGGPRSIIEAIGVLRCTNPLAHIKVTPSAA